MENSYPDAPRPEAGQTLPPEEATEAKLNRWVVPSAVIGATMGGLSGHWILGTLLGASIFGGVVFAATRGARRLAGPREAPLSKWALWGAGAGAVGAILLYLGQPDKVPTGVMNLGAFGAVAGVIAGLIKRANPS